MVESNPWKKYQAYALDNKLPYSIAVAASRANCDTTTLSGHRMLNRLYIPWTGGLVRFAEQIDGLPKQRWVAIEGSILLRNERHAPYNPFFEDTILSGQIENPHIGLIRDSFSTGAQMAYAEKRFSVSLDDPDAHLFGDSRIGEIAGQAALEIMFQDTLNREDYQFPNLSTFLSGRQIAEVLDINLPETHPLKVANRRKITRRQLIGAYAPPLITLGVVGAVTGGGGLLVKDGWDKWSAQKQDSYNISLKDQIAVVDIKRSQIDAKLKVTTDLDARRQLQAELEQLKAEKEGVESERSAYKAQHYGGKWWRFLVGVPVTLIGVGAIVGSVTEIPKEIRKEIAEIKKQNGQAEA